MIKNNRDAIVQAIVDKMFNNASIDELRNVYEAYQKHDLLDYSDEQIKELADEYCIDVEPGC